MINGNVVIVDWIGDSFSFWIVLDWLMVMGLIYGIEIEMGDLVVLDSGFNVGVGCSGLGNELYFWRGYNYCLKFFCKLLFWF